MSEQRFLIVVESGVEPFALGPFVSSEARDEEAVSQRRSDPGYHNGIFWADYRDGVLAVGAYPPPDGDGG